MELRRVADALLLAQASTLAAFLSPAANSRRTNTAQLVFRGSSNRPVQRGFSSTIQNKALKPSVTTSAAPPLPSEASRPESDPSAPDPNLEATANTLWPSRPQQLTGYSDRELSRFNKGGNSASDLLATLNEVRPSSSPDMKYINPFSKTLSGMSLTSDIGSLGNIPKAARKPIKLSPSTGRSKVIGGGGVDIATGFRLVEMSCARNKVKSDFMRQRFHERGGMKRKRLRRERWRTRFMEGFKATIARVKQLKNQGW
ncbi:uncharacterized protein L3040_001794 [Drepanopeziza brunnea f. sp. 'multigermtubi']|uniref:uncharacterized protein n=1 Tax=Drepanopeziza brunnea f. sp. 'multigermtubi' TaxID=698441 RepID=UPI0023992C5F|nr:hypothetical protein L3040_001794 [Drepanopeziza brunnea f. sp. 'multigermtubi']